VGVFSETTQTQIHQASPYQLWEEYVQMKEKQISACDFLSLPSDNLLGQYCLHLTF